MSPIGDTPELDLKTEIVKGSGIPHHYIANDGPGNAEIQRAIEAPKYEIFTRGIREMTRAFEGMQRVLAQPLAQLAEYRRRDRS